MIHARGGRYLFASSGAVLLVVALWTSAAQAQGLGPGQRLCDPEYQDCRADILSYIAQEKVEIDMGFWLMDDGLYANALIAAAQRGVKIRLLMDPRCTEEHAACQPINAQLSAAGLPMRNRIQGGIMHWKMALFAGQGQVEFSGANYSPTEMTPGTPYQYYTDEIVMFTNDPSLVQSFMSKFDDMWTSTTEFANYANVTGPLTRSYPTYPEDPELNFPNDEGYRIRALAAYNAETVGINVAMFRITDEQESDGIIAAVKRGVPVRLFTDATEYRNPARLWDAYNVDKMYYAGVSVRIDGHPGLNHEKLVLLEGQGMAIFGSSNWTTASTDTQREHNLFATESWIFTWAQNQFARKWNNGSGFSESVPFTPLPPDAPLYRVLGNGATDVPTQGVSLTWNGGLWGQLYDIRFGTSAIPPLVAENSKLGPSLNPTDNRTYALPALQPGTTYYWQIVSKTMAFVTAPGPVWSFTTAGTAASPPPPPPPSSPPPPSPAPPAPPPGPVDPPPTGNCLGTAPFPGAVCVGNGWVPGSEVPSSGTSTPSSSAPSSSAPSSSTPSPSGGSCLGTAPFPGAVCVGNGWVPGSMAPATGGSAPSSSAPSSATPSAGSCLGTAPFPGAVCVGNGWVPGSEVPSVPASPSPPASTPPTTGSTAACLGSAPFPGAVCVGNGWVPGAAAPPTTPPTTPGGCTTPDPFTAMGGGICTNGGWRPKG
jgi:hypothetical protein